MVDTARVIITDALLDLGVIADEETPTASQTAGGLRKLNNMIDSWKIQKLLGFGATSYVKQFVPNQAIYTIGTGGDFNIDRPDHILSAYLRNPSVSPPNTLDIPLKIYTDDEWQGVPLKEQVGQWPNYGIWFDSGFPLISAYVNPIPATADYSLVIWIEGVIGNLTIDQLVSLPSGYKRALTANLAIELADSYGVQVGANTAKIAENSKADLKVENYSKKLLTTATYGQYDITSNRIYVR